MAKELHLILVITSRMQEKAMSNQHSILSFDERKAAESAFRGLPADPTWSSSAHAIYHGILARTQGRNVVKESVLEAALF